MERKAALLMIGCAALFACVLTTSASANWTHKGKGELKENASITLSGELTLSTSAGNVSCPTSIGATLTASSSAGHVNSFTVSEPSKCDLTGSLAAICGTHGLTKVEKTGTWALTADETDITLTSIDVHYVLAGCLIPSFRLKGSATASLDKTTAIGKATLSGTQTLYNALGEESGSGELKGTLSASPAGTYGVKTGATVETKWTDSNANLTEDGKLTLGGTFSFSGSGGSVSCPASIKLLLESSTVEEEEPEGQVESFTVAKPAECDVSGGYKTTCGTNSIAKVEQTGTATLTATEEDITVSGLVLDYKFEKCAITTLRVEGNPTVSVSSPSTISSASFSAGVLEIYNSENEKIGTAEAGGSASASPSGTYQLTEDPEETEDPEGPDVWTDNDFELVDEETASQAFEGFFQFNAGANGTFGCEVTIQLKAAAGSHATITKFNPTTSTCVGTGPAFTGCVLTHHTTNIAAGWDLSFTTTPGSVTATTGDLTTHYEYHGCAVTTSHLEFASLTVTPTLNGQDTITALALEGFTTSGVFISGAFTPEGEPTLGLK